MRTRVLAIVLALVLIAGAGAGFVWWRHTEAERALDAGARSAAQALADGWAKRDLTGVALADEMTGTQFKDTFAGLGTVKPTVTLRDVTRNGTRANASLDVAWAFAADRTWSYSRSVDLVSNGTQWIVQTPTTGSLWAPDIKATDTVKLAKTWADRGNLLDAAGQPLMPMGNVYPVALDPVRATPAVAAALEELVGADKGSLVAKLAAATKSGSKVPIPVITYRQSDFDSRVQRLDALKGVIYPRTVQPLAKTRIFGQPLLGSFGEVTAEMIDASNGRFALGDRAGTSGLQRQYDTALGGTPGLKVESSTGKILFEAAAKAGTDVKTTLDQTVQQAAEDALTYTKDVPSALVAIDVPTGNVLAVANAPFNGFNRALTGQYPPGSTMKIATAYALLSAKAYAPDSPVSCPPTYTVDGRSFRNFEGEALGTIPMAQQFAHSCNTAFIQMAEKLPADGVANAASALGIGAGWDKTFGVSGTYAGSVPASTGGTDHAAGAIGQGRDLVSPAAMAVLVGSIARGSYIPPALVVDDPADRTPKPLDAAVTEQVRSMMGLVVTSGTGRALQGAKGGPVFGKTGTAEYGTDTPPKNRVWFVGYQGNIAFAVMVEDGVAGGSVAAPIAKRFLDYLHP